MPHTHRTFAVLIALAGVGCAHPRAEWLRPARSSGTFLCELSQVSAVRKVQRSAALDEAARELHVALTGDAATSGEMVIWICGQLRLSSPDGLPQVRFVYAPAILGIETINIVFGVSGDAVTLLSKTRDGRMVIGELDAARWNRFVSSGPYTDSTMTYRVAVDGGLKP